MWKAHREKLAGGRGLRFAFEDDAGLASYAEVLRGWEQDAGFRAQFLGLLAGVPYQAYRWETPPVTAAGLGRPFECVVLDSPELGGEPQMQVFAEHFAGAVDGVVAFPNLGGDAVLVVPAPVAPPQAYVHLAAFVRGAPAAQQHALWRRVGEAMRMRLGVAPLWLSTAGGGVAWLHVRLDDRPKYYGHAPYREVDSGGG